MLVKAKFTAKPGEQFVIRREAYQRIKQAFDEAGIHFAHRQVTVFVPPGSGLIRRGRRAGRPRRPRGRAAPGGRGLSLLNAANGLMAVPVPVRGGRPVQRPRSAPVDGDLRPAALACVLVAGPPTPSSPERRHLDSRQERAGERRDRAVQGPRSPVLGRRRGKGGGAQGRTGDLRGGERGAVAGHGGAPPARGGLPAAARPSSTSRWPRRRARPTRTRPAARPCRRASGTSSESRVWTTRRPRRLLQGAAPRRSARRRPWTSSSRSCTSASPRPTPSWPISAAGASRRPASGW